MLVNVPNHTQRPAPDPSDVGHRVTIRIHDEEPGKFRDLLGELVEVNQVLDKYGNIKRFDPERIVAWKRLER